MAITSLKVLILSGWKLKEVKRSTPPLIQTPSALLPHLSPWCRRGDNVGQLAIFSS